jgi:hypothetical protein
MGSPLSMDWLLMTAIIIILQAGSGVIQVEDGSMSRLIH